MKNLFRFDWPYFVAFVVLLVIEVLIALFVHENFVRPYIGDLLVVILIYCFIKSFFSFPVLKTAVAVLTFAIGIETLQYFNIVQQFGLEHSKLARTIIGTSFSPEDILAYAAGIGLVLLAERWKKQRVTA